MKFLFKREDFSAKIGCMECSEDTWEDAANIANEKHAECEKHKEEIKEKLWEQVKYQSDQRIEAQSKLQKAKEALEFYATNGIHSRYFNYTDNGEIARKVLQEIGK